MSYRQSHQGSGYGQCYATTYERGYYAALWQDVESGLVREVFTNLRTAGARTYLDFACGTGRITEIGASVFGTATGVDVSESMLAEARKRSGNLVLLQRDITKHLLDQTYDVVSTFRFFLNAEHTLRISALQSIHAALNSNGWLVANIHVNGASPLGIVYRTRNMIYGRPLNNTMRLEEFSELLATGGFSVEDIRWYGLYPRTGPWLGRLAETMVPRFERIFAKWRLIPRSLAQAFLVVCRRKP